MSPDLAIRITARNETARGFGEVATKAKAAANAIAATARPIEGAFKAANSNVANLAAQFNDIGVQLASGTSPLQIAIQQGTQIGQVLGPMGAKGAVMSLGTAFLSLLSPVNLLTIGAIALGGAVVQWLGSLLSDGPKAAATLEEHRNWLDKIIAGYGNAKSAVDTYLTETDKLPRDVVVGTLLDQQKQQIADVAARFREIVGLSEDISSILSQPDAFGISDNAALQLSQISELLLRITGDGSASKEEIDQLKSAFSDLAATNADEAVRSIAGEWLGLVDALRQAAIEAETTKVALLKVSAAGIGLSGVGGISAKGLETLYANMAGRGGGGRDKPAKVTPFYTPTSELRATVKDLEPLNLGLDATIAKTETLGQRVADTLAPAFTGLFTTLRKGGDVAGYVTDKLGNLADTLFNSAINSFLQKFVGVAFGGGPATAYRNAVNATGFGYGIVNAKGNVYQSPSLSAYSGQIVTQPTQFAFARGAALGTMGEAGAEAIMPLKRGRDGKLGVAGGAGGINVVINNNSSASVSASDGGVDVMGRRIIEIAVIESERRFLSNVKSGKYRGLGVNPRLNRV